MNENDTVVMTTKDWIFGIGGTIAYCSLDCLMGYCVVEYAAKPLGRKIVSKLKKVFHKKPGTDAVKQKAMQSLVSDAMKNTAPSSELCHNN